MKKAIVTGITGQDGAYLADWLIKQGYVVFGTYRRTSSVNFWRLEELGVRDHQGARGPDSRRGARSDLGNG